MVTKKKTTKKEDSKKKTSRKVSTKEVILKTEDSPLDFADNVSAADQFTESIASLRNTEDRRRTSRPEGRKIETRRTDSRSPASRTPASRTPASRTPTSRAPASRTPTSRTPTSRTSASRNTSRTTGRTSGRQVGSHSEPKHVASRPAYNSSKSSSVRKHRLVHLNQRVGVFVDVQNMYYSAKHLYNAKVNFRMVLEDGVAKRKLIRAIAYGIKADIKEESNFFEALENIGFEVKTKDLQVFVDGSKKGDWDVGIAVDAMRFAPKLDVVVLVSGDGDFRELVEYLKGSGCRVEVMGFKKTSSSKLLTVADNFIDLAARKYLIK